MKRHYLKKATQLNSHIDEEDVQAIVQKLLDELETGGDDVARRLAREFDRWDGEIIVSQEKMEAAVKAVSQRAKDDIQFAHDNICRFAEAQKATISNCEIEILPGLTAGQRQIPVASAGCYVPGGNCNSPDIAHGRHGRTCQNRRQTA